MLQQKEVDFSKMIFGVGKTPQPMRKIQLSCRVVPTNIIGFSRVEQLIHNVRSSKQRGHINSDLIMQEGNENFFDSPDTKSEVKRSNSMSSQKQGRKDV